MRYAFISDLHGNLPALELVLADLRQTPVDQIVCLGDVASLGPQPREVLRRLRELAIPCIMGNHDRYLLDLALTETQPPWLRAAELWGRAQLAAADLDFLRSFVSTMTLPLDGEATLLAFHGSPRSNEEGLTPLTPPAAVDEMLASVTAAVLVGGHTHFQMARPHRGRLLLNPGSLGMPFEFPLPGPEPRLLPWAEYALVEQTAGRLTTQLCRRPIDFAQLARIARASGYPDVERWIATWAA